jgi:hypothetical protein
MATVVSAPGIREFTPIGIHTSFFKGRVPDGMVVRHKCDNPACVNPDHLELGTHADNVADRDARGRTARGERLHAKLTEDDVLRIRADSRSHRAIGADYGVAHSTVGNIKRGRKWSHL